MRKCKIPKTGQVICPKCGKEHQIDKTTKKINNLFDTVIKIQNDCQGKMKEIQVLLQGLKKLRQGTAQNILGEKLSDTEVNEVITKIEANIKINRKGIYLNTCIASPRLN